MSLKNKFISIRDNYVIHQVQTAKIPEKEMEELETNMDEKEFRSEK